MSTAISTTIAPHLTASPTKLNDKKTTKDPPADAYEKFVPLEKFLSMVRPPKDISKATRDRPAYGYEEYKKIAQTGDVLLFAGNDPVCKLIKEITDGPFHHAAIVIKDKLDGTTHDGDSTEETEEQGQTVRVLQSTSEKQIVDFKGHKGLEQNKVDVVDFDTLMATEQNIVVRRLVCDDESTKKRIVDNIKKVVLDKYGAPYTVGSKTLLSFDFRELLESVLLPKAISKEPFFNRKDHDSFVCSTFAAYTLIKSGIINCDTHPLGSDQKFAPSMLDDENLSGSVPDNFMPRVRLDVERIVTNKFWPKPEIDETATSKKRSRDECGDHEDHVKRSK
eukprot:g1019.t1